MKKLLYLSLLAVLILQCSEDETPNPGPDPDPDPVNTATYLLSLDENFLDEVASGTLYISNSQGEIIGQAPLANSQQASVEIDFDPNEEYDATVYVELNNTTINLYQLFTYINVPPGSYTAPGLINSGVNIPTITINVTNIGGSLTVLNSSTSTNVSINGAGDYVITGNMLTAPGDYYVSVQKSGEQFPRYIWIENVPGNSTVDVDFNSLPLLDNTTDVAVPANTSSSFSVYGILNDDLSGVNQILHCVQKDANNNGTASSYEAYLPQNVFDKYRYDIGYGLSNDGVAYRYSTISAATPSSIPSVNLGFTLNNGSISNFSMATQGNYDHFQVRFDFQNIPQGVVVFHTFYGAASQNINFSKANLFDNIFANQSNISSGMFGSSLTYSLKNYSQFNGYSAFIQAPWVYGPVLSDNEFVESIDQ
ncbi:hypothetical protein J1N09_07115 [Aureitalea sp. L0-47]|uniref:hypothetical protein n=1 Tax=Aureitalea sp. L0-47 TaxID=2816962 RepID=UPI0022376FE3|nr:hypothetical protein [Aureitalea sp. L0-47]MCW5519601.1 hypothetical protein [Aureitalea sp. L0-47]